VACQAAEQSVSVRRTIVFCGPTRLRSRRALGAPMPKLKVVPKLSSFHLPALPHLAALKDTRVIVRLILGLLLLANVVAAGFAFHFFDDSPEQLARQVQSTRQQTLAAVIRLNRARQIALKVDTGREEGTKFISTYMTSRRITYSTILTELNQTAAQAQMTPKDALIGLDAIQGTDSLDMMTVTPASKANTPTWSSSSTCSISRSASSSLRASPRLRSRTAKSCR